MYSLKKQNKKTLACCECAKFNTVSDVSGIKVAFCCLLHFVYALLLSYY